MVRNVLLPTFTEPRQPSGVASEETTFPAVSIPCASLKSCQEAAFRKVDSSKDGMGRNNGDLRGIFNANEDIPCRPWNPEFNRARDYDQ